MTDLKKYIILKSENIFNAFDQISRVGNTLIVVYNNNNYAVLRCGKSALVNRMFKGSF